MLNDESFSRKSHLPMSHEMRQNELSSITVLVKRIEASSFLICSKGTCKMSSALFKLLVSASPLRIAIFL